VIEIINQGERDGLWKFKNKQYIDKEVIKKDAEIYCDSDDECDQLLLDLEDDEELSDKKRDKNE